MSLRRKRLKWGGCRPGWKTSLSRAAGKFSALSPEEPRAEGRGWMVEGGGWKRRPQPIPRAIDVPAPTFNKTLVCLDLIDDYTPVRY